MAAALAAGDAALPCTNAAGLTRPSSAPVPRDTSPPASAAPSSPRPSPPRPGKPPHDRRGERGPPPRGARSRHAFPRPRGHRAVAQDRRRESSRRRQLHHQARRNPGPGRRKRLRQDDDRSLHPAPGTADGGRDPVRRTGRQPHAAPRAAVAAPPQAADLPGSLQLAQSPPYAAALPPPPPHVSRRHPPPPPS